MRVVIVAHNALTAETLRRALRHAPNTQVMGFVDGRRPCADSVAGAAPDVVVVDDMGASPHALARVTEIRRAAPSAKVVLLTSSTSGKWLAEARESGIDAAISRTVGPMMLGALVREIVGGTIFHAFREDPAPMPQHVTDELTSRELQILQLVARGASNGRIAAELWVTEQTVKFHLSNVYRKLSVANRTEASHFAHVNGLLDQPTSATRIHEAAVAA